MVTNTELKISKTLIQYKNQTFPIKNISYSKIVERDGWKPESEQDREDRIRQVKEESAKKNKNNLKYGVMIIGPLLLLGLFHWGWWAAAAFFLFGLVLQIQEANKAIEASKGKRQVKELSFGIAIGLNSGDTELFWSKNKDFIHLVNDLIVEALSGTSDNATTIINIEKQEINNTQHNTITNHYAIDIKHQHGYSADNLKILTGEFSRAIKDLGEKIEALAKPELKENYQAMVKEFNAEKPNEGTIKKLWNVVKAAAEGLDVAKKIHEASGLIMSAASIVGTVMAT